MSARGIIAKGMLALVLVAVGMQARADARLQAFIERTLDDARTRANLPAVAALVQVDGRVEAQAAIGVRAVGRAERVTLDDSWHLGSDTKAMTATLLMRLAERKQLSLDDTMATSFPGLAAHMDPAMHDVTVAQLLTHTSGVATLTSDADMPAFLAVIKTEKDVRAQRAAMAAYYLGHPPASPVGEFSYSNIGYTLAGAVAEQRTGRPWEDLVRSEIWKPLGIRQAGFGPPGRSKSLSEPLGHELRDGRYVPLDPGDPESDNPPAVGPAGRVHISPREWLLFAQDQLDGEHGKGKLLTPEGYRRLHTEKTSNYGMGWGILRDPDGSIALLTHTGSNGYWIAIVRIVPKRNLILLINVNAGGVAAEQAARELARALQDHLLASG